MPMEGVHTARQKSPDRCDKIRQKEITTGVSVNLCIVGGKSTVQSVHFEAKHFTPEQAKKWLADHDFSADQFEEAKPAHAAAAAPAANVTCQMVDPKDCPHGEDCPMRQMAMAAEGAAEAVPAGLEAADIAALAGPVEIRGTASGTCEIEAALGEAAVPRANILAYTGQPMPLTGFRLPVVVDLETLKVPKSQKVPLLRDHESGRIAGHTDKLDLRPQRLRASGPVYGADAHTADLFHGAKHGFPWQASIGAKTAEAMQHVPAGETVKVNGRVWKGPLLVARHAHLREISLLPMGADADTDASFGAADDADIRASAAAPPADLLAYDPDQPRDDHGRFGEGGGGGGGDKGGGKSDGKSDEKPPKLTQKDLSKAATAELQKAAAAEKAGDKAAAKNHRAAAYGFNKAAQHLDDGDRAKAAAVAKAAHEFATGKRSLKAGAATDIAGTDSGTS